LHTAKVCADITLIKGVTKELGCYEIQNGFGYLPDDLSV